MKGASQQLFTSATFAGDHDGRIGICDGRQHAPQALRRVADTDVMGIRFHADRLFNALSGMC